MEKTNTLDRMLKKWESLKNEKEKLEKEIEECKKIATKYLNKENLDTVKTENYKLSRRRTTRSYISKENLPKDIWEKYSSRSSYDVLTFRRLVANR